MKKTLLFTLILIANFVFATNASAGAFFGIRFGAEKLDVEEANTFFEDSQAKFIGAGFVGYHYSFFRLEAEYMYQAKRSYQSDADRVSIETHSLMGNLYFSPPIKSVLKPYLMGGVGAAFLDTKEGNFSDDNTDLAWQLGLGLELEFTENVFLEVGGRFVNMGEAEVNNKSFEQTGFNYFGGLRFEY